MIYVTFRGKQWHQRWTQGNSLFRYLISVFVQFVWFIHLNEICTFTILQWTWCLTHRFDKNLLFCFYFYIENYIETFTAQYKINLSKTTELKKKQNIYLRSPLYWNKFFCHFWSQLPIFNINLWFLKSIVQINQLPIYYTYPTAWGHILLKKNPL